MFIPHGEAVPGGAFPWSGKVSFSDFARGASEGFIPLGEVDDITYGLSATTHDIAHAGGFLQDPKFMAAYREAYAHIYHVGSAPEKLQFRMYAMSENLETLPIHRAADFDHFASSQGINLSPTKSVTVSEVNSQLARKSDAEINAMIRQLSRSRFVEPHGGTARDLISVPNAVAKGGTPAELFDYPSGMIERAINARGMRAALTRRTEVARALTAIHNARELDPAVAITEAAQGQIPKSSSVYEYFCESGVWPATEYTYKSFCH